MKCRECGNTAEFNIYSNFCYEVTFADNNDKLDIEKSDEFIDDSISTVFCRLCDSDDIEYSKKEVEDLLAVSYY